MSHILDFYHQRAEDLVRYAFEQGVVITVDLAPKTPLAMGSYMPVVSARLARQQPKFCGNCDSALPRGCDGTFENDVECANHKFDLDAMCKLALSRLRDGISVDAEEARREVRESFFWTREHMRTRFKRWHAYNVKRGISV